MKSNKEKDNSLRLLKKCDDSGRVANFYGFLPAESPKITKADIDAVKGLNTEWHPAEKAAILREFSELKGVYLPQPLMLFYEKPFPGSSERKKANRIECELVILGSNRSICESILIQATRAILEHAGYKESFLKLNSTGSKESIAEFERKMSAFVKKRMGDFPADLRQSLKKDLFYLTKSKEEKYREWIESAPQSVDYLSEQSRLHLKEILEFLETVDMPYIMDSTLIGDLEYSTETVFEIVSDLEGGETLARGLRWSRLSKRIDLKREVGAVSVSISIKTQKAPRIVPLKIAKPNFYLIQFGPEAKQKSFLVLEKLRKAGIPVTHSLAKDKLTGQISSVEQGGVPFMILIGQKEAIDNIVVIRNSTTRVQHVVGIPELGEYIKSSKEFK